MKTTYQKLLVVFVVADFDGHENTHNTEVDVPWHKPRSLEQVRKLEAAIAATLGDARNRVTGEPLGINPSWVTYVSAEELDSSEYQHGKPAMEPAAIRIEAW